MGRLRLNRPGSGRFLELPEPARCDIATVLTGAL